MKSKETAIRAIKEMIERETKAWDNKDVDLLMTIFHHDMVWPWPKSPQSHDPMDWVIEWGRYNYDRWRKGWLDLFNTHELIHNHRTIQKIEISKEMDGAFAVVDINTLWIDKQGNKNQWEGRTCKIYTKVNNEWKMIAQTGVLKY
jgi:ketosteroid isomerase-like protein